jgi:CubicO group peptidase (beta-lactamase class C family)
VPDKQSGFSGTALVAKDGRPLLEQGYGAADRTRGVPNNPRTRFCIASLGKMFTAVAIAQLVQQGKVSFADPIGKYLRGFATDVADKVTIADLLTHTSGLGDVALGTAQPPRTLAGIARIVEEPLQDRQPLRGAYSTVRDLLRFAQALTHYQLLSPTLTNTILAGKVNVHRPGGPAVDRYGYGFADQTINGIRIVGHNGGSPGYEGQLDIYLGKGYVVALLANQDRVPVPAIRESEALLTG